MSGGLPPRRRTASPWRCWPAARPWRTGIEPEQLSFIVLGTNTPPHFFPAGAIQIQEELGIGGKAAAFDLQAGCCGFNYALYVGERLVAPEGPMP